jgi:hypothetical protein
MKSVVIPVEGGVKFMKRFKGGGGATCKSLRTSVDTNGKIALKWILENYK